MPTVFNYDIHYLSKLLKLFLFYLSKVPLYKDLKLIVTHLVQLSNAIRCVENTKMVACTCGARVNFEVEQMRKKIFCYYTLVILFMYTLKEAVLTNLCESVTYILDI